MSGVQLIEVSADDPEQRLDRWFRKQFPHVPQGRIEKMCRKGEIRVDGARAKSATRVAPGQMIRVPPLPDPEAPRPAVVARISDADAQMMRDAVIYKDDHIIALNKPPGLPVQGGSGQTRHVDGLAEAIKFEKDEKPRLVHRLDKDTSGVLLMGRTAAGASKLTAAFRHKNTRKIYWAVVGGVPEPRFGTIKFALAKAPGHGKKGEGEKMICLHPDQIPQYKGAKRAHTDYATLCFLGARAAWMALVPITGRTHQLRAHMAEMGHPIIGDGKYGGSGQENLGDGWGAGLGAEISRKLHLHARSITLEHPFTGRELHIETGVPPHMQATWNYFGWDGVEVPVDPFEKGTEWRS